MDALELRGELEKVHTASFGWALCCCGHRREDAEEVLQSAYLKVLEDRAGFDGKSSFRTWWFGVIRNTAAEHRRRAWMGRAFSMRCLLQQPSPAPGAGPEAAAASAESSHILCCALARLPSRQREVLHLVFYQELTVEEAAGVLGVSVGTARTHFARGKDRLREILVSREGRNHGA